LKGEQGWVPPLKIEVEVESKFIVLGVVIGIEKLSPPIAKEGVCTLVKSIVVLVLLTLDIMKQG